MEISNQMVEDIRSICSTIVERFVTEDNQSCDYCIYCFERYGNISKFYYEKGIKVPHHEYCDVLIAQRILDELNKEK